MLELVSVSTRRLDAGARFGGSGPQSRPISILVLTPFIQSMWSQIQRCFNANKVLVISRLDPPAFWLRQWFEARRRRQQLHGRTRSHTVDVSLVKQVSSSDGGG